MLSDIFPYLTRLSLIFQRKHIDLSLLDSVLTSTVIAVRQLKTTDGQHMQSLRAAVEEENITIPSGGEDSFRNKIYNKYIDNICTNLEERFPNIAVVSSFSVFDLSGIDAEYIYNGSHRAQLEELSSHYEMDAGQVLSEWDLIKIPMMTTYEV
ncbi:uncharacterized protein [Ptychodera flava]|uniref:uncharacterized protein isoform X3 n=1 Tax=Ptychodera flava TaxID=63121 RepID=UPI00396A1926